MIGLDTNVLLRYLLRDDEARWAIALEEIDGAIASFPVKIGWLS